MNPVKIVITTLVVVVALIIFYKIYKVETAPLAVKVSNEKFGFGLIGDLIKGGEDIAHVIFDHRSQIEEGGKDLVHLAIEHKAQVEAAAKEAAKLAEALYKKRQAELAKNRAIVGSTLQKQLVSNLRPGMCNCASCANGTHPAGCDCSVCGGLYSNTHH